MTRTILSGFSAKGRFVPLRPKLPARGHVRSVLPSLPSPLCLLALNPFDGGTLELPLFFGGSFSRASSSAMRRSCSLILCSCCSTCCTSVRIRAFKSPHEHRSRSPSTVVHRLTHIRASSACFLGGGG